MCGSRFGLPFSAKAARTTVAVEDSQGSLEAAPRTDKDGYATFSVPDGRALRLFASPIKPSSDRSQLDIGALAEGERREVEIELETHSDRAFYGLVLAREDDTPLPGAQIKIHGRTLRTDDDGRFKLWGATFGASGARIQAEGRAQVKVSLSAGHETPEQAYVARLPRSAGTEGSRGG